MKYQRDSMENQSVNYYSQPNMQSGTYTYLPPKDPFVNREARHLTRLSLLAGAAILSFLGMQNIMAVLLSVFGLSELYMTNYSFQLIFGTLCSIICIFVPFIIVYALYSEGDKKRCFDFGKPVSKKAFWLAVAAGFMVCLMSDYIASGFNSFVDSFGVLFEDIDMKGPSNAGEFMLYVLECAVVPALVEEFAVRGVIMQPLRRYGDRFAIVMSSLIFALMHGNMMQIPVALVAGIALGYFAISTGSIWTSVTIHFLNNLLAVIVSSASESSVVGIIFSLVSTASVVVGIICLVKFIKTEHYGLGITKAPRTEKIFLLVSAAVFMLVSYFSTLFEKTLPLIYIGSLIVLAVFFVAYNNANRKELKTTNVTGLSLKMKTALYIGAPTFVMGYYSLTFMTADMVSSEGIGSFIFKILLFAAYFAVCIAAVSRVRKSEQLEKRKIYTFSAVLLGVMAAFTAIAIFII